MDDFFDEANEYNTGYCSWCGTLQPAEEEYCPDCGDGLQTVDRCPICNGLKWVERSVCDDCADEINEDITKLVKKYTFKDNDEFLDVLQEVLL